MHESRRAHGEPIKIARCKMNLPFFFCFDLDGFLLDSASWLVLILRAILLLACYPSDLAISFSTWTWCREYIMCKSTSSCKPCKFQSGPPDQHPRSIRGLDNFIINRLPLITLCNPHSTPPTRPPRPTRSPSCRSGEPGCRFVDGVTWGKCHATGWPYPPIRSIDFSSKWTVSHLFSSKSTISHLK